MLGAVFDERGCTRFVTWAPYQEKLWIKIGGGGSHEMERIDRGYFALELCGAEPGDRYWFEFGDGSLVPDPVSRFQSEGVHGTSEIVDPRYHWKMIVLRWCPRIS